MEAIRAFYSPKRKLSKSLFGAIYMAEDRSTKASVVLKVSNKKEMDAKRDLICEDVHQEQRIMTRLAREGPHPNILHYVECIETPKVHCLVLEYLPNGDLYELLDRHGPFPEDMAASVISQVLAGMAHLHRMGVAHHDMSLENLLVANDMKSIKICDFGQAQAQDAMPRNESHRKPGKLRYMAPEIYAAQPYSAFSADLFSVGVITFMLLFHCHPFETPSAKECRSMALILQGKLSRLLELSKQKPISKLALDFLDHLLCPEKTRLTLKQAQHHPWLELGKSVSLLSTLSYNCDNRDKSLFKTVSK